MRFSDHADKIMRDEPIHLNGLRIAHIFEGDVVVITCRASVDGREMFCKIPLGASFFYEMQRRRNYPDVDQMGQVTHIPSPWQNEFEVDVLRMAQGEFFRLAKRERINQAVFTYPPAQMALWLGFESRDLGIFGINTKSIITGDTSSHEPY